MEVPGSSPNNTPGSSDSERNSDNNFEEIPKPEEISESDYDNNLPETVTLLYGANGAKVYVLGTAHFSEASQNEVSKLIQVVRPDAVMVELCTARIDILQLDEKTLLEEAKNINLEKIRTTIRQNGLFHGLVYILLLNMSAEFAKKLGMAPGGEFRRAFAEARKINCEIHLGDRPIKITLQRALAKLTWFQTVSLCWQLLTTKDPISAEDVEKCKKRDMLEELLAEMAGDFPALGEVLVDERNIYLTHTLQALAKLRIEKNGILVSPKVVGVVGIGHLPGIIKLWPESQAQYISKIMEIPPPTLSSKIVRITFKLSMLTFGGYLIYKFAPIPRKITSNIPHFFSLVHQKVLEKVQLS